jgi:hypothetical protein
MLVVAGWLNSRPAMYFIVAKVVNVLYKEMHGQAKAA